METVNENIKKHNIAIIGSRKFNNYQYAEREILKILKSNDITINKIISGGAKGADEIAEKFAKNYNIPLLIFNADWSKGRSAGPIRYTKIINNCDFVIAFWDLFIMKENLLRLL